MQPVGCAGCKGGDFFFFFNMVVETSLFPTFQPRPPAHHLLSDSHKQRTKFVVSFGNWFSQSVAIERELQVIRGFFYASSSLPGHQVAVVMVHSYNCRVYPTLQCGSMCGSKLFFFFELQLDIRKIYFKKQINSISRTSRVVRLFFLFFIFLSLPPSLQCEN